MTKDKDRMYYAILGICIKTLINAMIIFALAEGFVMSYHFSYRLFADLPMAAASGNEVSVTVGEGSSVVEIADVLQQNKVIDSEYIFIARAYLGKYHKRMKAGTYTFGPGMTPDEICRMLCGMQSEVAS